jgi:hypothetical protein
MSVQALPQAVAALVQAQAAYASARGAATSLLLEAQTRRETAMRHVAALGLSRRRIAALTDMSHTRINQILGAGNKPLPTEAHLPSGSLGTPSSASSAAIRLMAEQGPRTWKVREVATALKARGWPCDNLQPDLVALATDGVLLTVDGGGFSIHGPSAKR